MEVFLVYPHESIFVPCHNIMQKSIPFLPFKLLLTCKQTVLMFLDIDTSSHKLMFLILREFENNYDVDSKRLILWGYVEICPCLWHDVYNLFISATISRLNHLQKQSEAKFSTYLFSTKPIIISWFENPVVKHFLNGMFRIYVCFTWLIEQRISSMFYVASNQVIHV